MTTLAFEIDYAHEHHGWIDCTLTMDEKPHHLSASGAVPPFLGLMYFVKAIARHDLPHTFHWDEEGFGAKFEVTAITDSLLVHLKITHTNEKVEVWIDADIERETVIQAFLPPLVDFAQNYEIVDRSWELPRRVVEHIQSSIAKEISLQPDPHAPKHADFIIYPNYGLDLTEDHVSLQLWIDDAFRFHIDLQDTDPFWLNLVNFLEKVAVADFPAQLEYTDNWQFSVMGVLIPSFKQFERKYRLVASATDDRENFLLQKFFLEWENEDKVPTIAEVINCRQFTSGFVESFENFLQVFYQMSIDGDGKTFDLRSLSLEKLI
jgi:hypothetical protein